MLHIREGLNLVDIKTTLTIVTSSYQSHMPSRYHRIQKSPPRMVNTLLVLCQPATLPHAQVSEQNWFEKNKWEETEGFKNY